MEFSDLAPLILPVLWVLFSLFRRAAKGRDDLPSQTRRGPLVPAGPLAAQRVERVQQALSGASAACDPRMASLLAPLLQSATDELEVARQSLSEGPPDPHLLQQLEELDTFCRQVSGLGRQRAALSLTALHDTGDRLAVGLFSPVQGEAARKGLALDMRPPLVVVGAPSGTPLAGMVELPATVANRPWEWSLLAESLGQRIADASVEEAFGALRLDVGDEPLTADSPALARVLFGAWLYVVIADAAALLLLGPAYLQALATRLRAPGRARSTTQVQLGDGGLSPIPAPHARIHLAAEWLSLQGEEQASRQIRAAWDEEQGHPEALSLFTRDGEMLLPLRVISGYFHDILEDLGGLRLAALGRSRLAELPGLSGWPHEAGPVQLVRDRLVRGEPAAAGPRALLAATIEAALERPGAGPSISTALLASLQGEGATRKPRAAARVPPRPAARSKPAAARRVAEALVLGELLLEPPSRR